MQNQHPAEKQLLPTLLLFAALFNGIGWLTGYKASGTVLVIVLALIAAITWATMHYLIPGDWQRYAAWQEPLP